MSHYTTELRFICESLAGLNESVGFKSIDKVIDESMDSVFDFYYPIFDEVYRRPLQKKIIRHFYTREIGEETFGLFQLRLDSKMNEIMPYYNQMYASELLKFNPFYDTDYTIMHKGYAKEHKGQKVSDYLKSHRDNNTDFTESVYNDITFTRGETDTTAQTTAYDEQTSSARNENVEVQRNETTNTGEHTASTTDFQHEMNETDKSTKNTNSTTDVHSTSSESYDEKTGMEHTSTENITTHNQQDTDGVHNTESSTDTTNDHTQELSENTGSTTENAKDTTKNDTNTVTQTTNTDTTEQSEGNKTTNRTEKTDTHGTNQFSDTPQGSLEDVEEGQYLTNATVTTEIKNVTGDETTDTNTQGESHVKTTNNVNTVDNATENVDFSETTTGEHSLNDKQNDKGKKTSSEEFTIDDTVVDDGSKDTEFSESQNTIKHSDTNTLSNTNTVFSETVGEAVTKENTTTENTQFNETKTIDTTEDEHTSTQDTETVNATKHSDTAFNEQVREDENTSTDNDTITHNNTEDITKFNQTDFNILKHRINNSDKYVNHVFGKMQGASMSRLLNEFRSTFLNIDLMIIEELKPLFFNLY